MEGKFFDIVLHGIAGAVGGIVRYFHMMSLHDNMRISVLRMLIHILLGMFVGILISDLIAPGSWGRLAVVMGCSFSAPMILYSIQQYVPRLFSRKLRGLLDDLEDTDDEPKK